MVAQIDSRYRAAGPGRTLSRLLCYALFEGRPLTTRGRWINPLVLAGHRLHARTPVLRAVERPIFIMGVGRSGTTVLGTALSLHRQVAFLNEPKALWHAGVGQEDVIGSYDRGVARYRLGRSDVDGRVSRRLRRIYGACLFWTRRRRIVEKNAEIVHRVPFLRAVFPDARFLLLVRNGRDVSQSIHLWSQRHGKRRGGELHDWWGADRRKWRLMLDELARAEPTLQAALGQLERVGDDRQWAAVEWSLAMRAGLAEAERSPESVRVIRFESLAERPLEVLADILRFGGLDEDQRVTRYAADVINPARVYDGFDLHAAVAPFFHTQMEALGYRS